MHSSRDDGGLNEALQGLKDAEAREREAAAREAAIEERARASLGGRFRQALEEQDVQTQKAVEAFLAQAVRIRPAHSVTVGWRGGREASRWRSGVAPTPVDEAAHQVLDWSRRFGEDGFTYRRVNVSVSGYVMFDSGLWHDEYERVVRLNGAWTRKPLSPGKLPFYRVADDRGGHDAPIDLGPLRLSNDEGLPIETIERTTEWFVQTLASYLHEHLR